MAANYIRIAVLRSAPALRRGISSTAGRSGAVGAAELSVRDRVHPRIGNRDIVGYGKNGSASFIESVVDPYPAIRFGSNTAETDALMQKAKGDWKQLSLAEKKTLYRHSFCQTYAEMQAPNTEWKSIAAAVFVLLGVSCWIYLFLRNTALSKMEVRTMTPEWQQAQRQRQIDQGHGLVDGIGAKWDYENNRWKK